MPRTAITPQNVAQNAGPTVTWTAADAANGMVFPNDGETVVLLRNADAAPKTVTIDSVADQHGREGDLVMTVPAVSSGNDGVCCTSRLPEALFNQAGTGLCNIDFSAATNLFVAVLRIAPRR